MSHFTPLRQWLKTSDKPIARQLHAIVIATRQASCPTIPGVHRVLYELHTSIRTAWATATRMLWYTPLFQSRLEASAPRLYVYDGMPLVLGSVRISMGDRVRISGITTITGRTAGAQTPYLTVGNNVDIGWQTTIAVGRRIHLGNNVRIAGRAFLAGYPGHPLDAAARAEGQSDTDDQTGDIILEDDVWLATGVTVSAGVTIGRGTIVAAGSVVTHDLPDYVLAGGVPAKIIRALPCSRSAR